MSQGRLVTHWAVLLMEDHFVAYTEVKEKSDIASVYISVEKTQKAEVAVLTIIGDGGRKGSELNAWRQSVKR